MSRTDTTDKLERIRQAQEGIKEPTESPEVYRCPIEGCDRVVIDSLADLRHHVRQSEDDIHRYRTLSEDLEIETAWSEMDWGPGVPM